MTYAITKTSTFTFNQKRNDDPILKHFIQPFDTIRYLFDRLRAQHRGFLIGEHHEDESIKKILIKELDDDKFDLLAMEHFWKEMQKQINTYINKGTLSQDLDNHLNILDQCFAHLGSDYPYTNRKVLDKAREKKVPIFALDQHQTRPPLGYYSENIWGYMRCSLMNSKAAETINRVLNKNKNKNICCVVGAAHLNNQHFEIDNQILTVDGISELTGLPSVAILPIELEHIFEQDYLLKNKYPLDLRVNYAVSSTLFSNTLPPIFINDDDEPNRKV